MTGMGGLTVPAQKALRALRDVGCVRVNVVTMVGYVELWRAGLAKDARRAANGKWADMVLTDAGKRAAARLLPTYHNGDAVHSLRMVPA